MLRLSDNTVMPENTPEISPMDVTRNEVTFSLKAIAKKGNLNNVDPALATYLGFDASLPFEQVAKFIGEDMLKDIAIGFLNKRAQNLFKSATNDGTTPLNRDLLKSSIESLSVVGESISDLEERKEEVTAELMAAISSGADNDKLKKISESIKQLNEAIESKRRDRKPKVVENAVAAAA